ncbi:MAG: hypothetical protein ACI92S_003547 [Planctomycetaceae bacterium]|jgi:hypothetical protein
MMDRHGIRRERRKQVSQRSPLCDFQVAIARDLIDVCENDRLPQASRPIGRNQRIGFGGQHRARIDGISVAFPVIPQPGKKEQTTFNGVASFAAANERLVKLTADQHAALRLERSTETPGRVHRFAAGVEPFPLILLASLVVRRRLPVKRQPAPLPQLDDPVIRFRIESDYHDIAHRIPVGLRNQIEQQLSVLKRLGDLSQILFDVKSMAHSEKLRCLPDFNQQSCFDCVC